MLAAVGSTYRMNLHRHDSTEGNRKNSSGHTHMIELKIVAVEKLERLPVALRFPPS